MRKINCLILIVICYFFGFTSFKAFSISGPSTVYVGESINVRVETSNLAGLFSVSSSNTSIASGGFYDWLENETRTIVFTANSVGQVRITLKAVNVSDTSENDFDDFKDIYVNVIAKQTYTPQPVYTYTPTYYVAKSANNNLSSIKIGDATLDPEFDPGTTEYNILMPAGTKVINIEVTKEDEKSNVTGDGEREVVDGPNNLEVVVTAESGATKTYTLIVTVEEEAIPVRFDANDYTFIRHSENLPKVSSYYSVTTTKYNDFEVPAYYSEITKYTLVGLKNNKGKANLYIYNPKTHAFRIYNEINLGNIAVYVQTPSKSNMIPDLKKTTVKINSKEYDAYQFDLESNYYLIYGTNANTNNTGWFMYDLEENTLQRYNMNEIVTLTKQRDNLFIIVKLLSALCIFSIVFMAVIHKLTQKKEN